MRSRNAFWSWTTTRFIWTRFRRCWRSWAEYRVVVASTGFDAGALVVEFNPQLIILDIQLSDMDGRMVCERVKTRDETRSTRILAISGYLTDDEAQRLRDHGFDDYLKKPFGMDDLHGRVSKLLSLPPQKVARPKA
jgi:DNA-binding response OmpR family regulator